MWHLPYDHWSIATIAVCAVSLGIAASGRLPHGLRLALVLLVAAALRIDASWQWSLHAWDERFHALVAKRMLDDPLKPALYPADHADADSSQWETAHVWLHKPPLALWSIAASYALFGVNELALRVPSIVWGVAAVGLTYLIGSSVFGSSAGLIAAGFHAVNGFLVSLVAGRRVADHVDTLLILLVELGALIVLTRIRRRDRYTATACGLVAGLAILTKSLPGLLPLALLAVVPHRASRHRVLTVLVASAAAALVAVPWFLYLRYAFPNESAHEWAYTLNHLTDPLEGQGGPWWTYLTDGPRFFGELLPLAILWFGWMLTRADPDPRLRVLAVWLVLPYAIFSASATKLPNLVMLAAPALFVISAGFWSWLRDRTAATARLAWLRVVALALLLVLPGRYLLEPTGPLEARDRSPADTQVLRQLDGRLGPGPAVLFNAPDAVSCMFYSRMPCYERLPTAAEFQQLKRSGVTTAIYSKDLAGVDLASYPGAIAIAAPE